MAPSANPRASGGTDVNAIWGTVESADELSPHMMRVTFGGEGLADFRASEFTDAYVNALFLPDGSSFSVPFDVDEARAAQPDERPRGRRITIRSWDSSTRRLVMDIVGHGDVGYAGRWAQKASPGDRLQMVGPTGGYRPDPRADWYLMAGDESALPAIAASLEVAPAGRPAVALVVVGGPAEEIELSSPAELELTWLHRSTTDSPEELLARAVQRLEWHPGKVDVFVHGEAAEVRAVRRFLLAERGLVKEEASISPYWRRGKTDEAWREVKADWMRQQNEDT